jgi:hypothetical protein
MPVGVAKLEDVSGHNIGRRPIANGWLSRKIAMTLRVWSVFMLVYIPTVLQVKI